MRKISSDTAYYLWLLQIFIGPFFIVSIAIAVFPLVVACVVFLIFGAVTAYNLFSISRKKHVWYDGQKLMIKPYFGKTENEIAYEKIVEVTPPSPTIDPFRNRKVAKIKYLDEQSNQRTISFLCSDIYSINELRYRLAGNTYFSQGLNYGIKKREIDNGKRITSAFTDIMTMTMIAMPFFLPETIYQFTHRGAAMGLYSFSTGNWYIAISNIGLALFLCKDCINGQSPAKHLFNLQVVDNKTGEVASVFRCLVRNIFIIIWPIEAIFIMITPQRRLGDLIAGTKVVVIDQEPTKFKIDVVRLAIVFALAYPVFPLISLATDKIFVNTSSATAPAHKL